MDKNKRKELINKVKEITKSSELVPESAIEEAEKMDEEQLEKYVILLYSSFVKEKDLWENEKNTIKESLINTYRKIQNIYQKGTKRIMNILEKEDKQKEKCQIQQIERQINEL